MQELSVIGRWIFLVTTDQSHLTSGLARILQPICGSRANIVSVVAHFICFGAKEKLKIDESLTTKHFRWHICFDVDTIVDREWYQGVFNNTLLVTQLRDVFSLLTEKVPTQRSFSFGKRAHCTLLPSDQLGVVNY